ncbi:hypothetical protein V101_02631 [Staphylococcus aureus Rd.51]|nr:hypothetical protein V077_02687 [Staphylococcus aureus 2010-60-6511-39]EZX72857.1 hypothetical protein V110_02771 [Staphylococcus aureus Chi-8]EZY83302.1 hypothetical protein V101_02631 [Staphylococcus aureus Rd.51]KAH95329.1 hypothetical protein W726_02609 [Staphylococcus aureus VET1877R]
MQSKKGLESARARGNMGGRKAMPQEKKITLNIYTIPKIIQDKKLLIR